jgi:Do/DeqQ family serine protease
MQARLFVRSTLAAALLVTVTFAPAAFAQGSTPPPRQNGQATYSLAPMIKKVSPTVVNIATRGTVRDGRNPLLDDPFFRRFFGDDPQFGPRERTVQSAGSGVVIDARNGYIITNAHVIENANEITVTTQDNRNYTARVVGKDQGSDVAVLKLEKQANLVAIPLGDSSRLEVGDFVVAIGNPFGLQHTVTSGIVSALGRSGITEGGYEDFIQTDASINPGNSGGALVNLNGELVGINSAILSRTGGNIGIGFAIPVNMVKSVMEQLIEHGSVRRGLLGVSIYTLTPDLAQALGAPPDVQGALVSEVAPNSAAEKAGIKLNDIITSVNNQPVRSNGELRNAIGLLRIGDKVEIGLLRDGKPRKVTANIGERSDVAAASAAEIHRGLEGADLVDAADAGGVTVRAVEPGSPAAQSGLRPNDVIIGVNRARVANVQQLRAAAQGAASLVLNIRRGNTPLLLPIR